MNTNLNPDAKGYKVATRIMRNLEQLKQEMFNSKNYENFEYNIWDSMGHFIDQEGVIPSTISDEENDKYYSQLIVAAQERALGIEKLQNKIDLMQKVIDAQAILVNTWIDAAGELIDDLTDKDPDNWKQFDNAITRDEKICEELQQELAKS